MTYYIVNTENDHILDQMAHMDDEKAQAQANEFGCAIYVIRGEHAGYIAEPTVIKQQAVDSQIQYNAGFRAQVRGEPNDGTHGIDWQEGWFKAWEAGPLAATMALHLDAEE